MTAPMPTFYPDFCVAHERPEWGQSSAFVDRPSSTGAFRCGQKTLSCWHQYLDECPPDRGRNPRCFNGLPCHCEFPQIKIVCQQIRGIPFECFSTPQPASSPALGGLIQKLTNTL